MKTVSLKQPFVGWIATGEKTLVKRTWRTSNWGPLHIMSSLKPGALGTRP